MANDSVNGAKLSILAIEGRPTQALMFRPSRRREAAFATGAIAAAVLGGLIAVAPEQAVASRAVGLLTLVLLGTVGTRRVLRLRAGGEYLALTAEGIAYSTWLGSEFVQWEDIETTHLGAVAGVRQGTDPNKRVTSEWVADACSRDRPNRKRLGLFDCPGVARTPSGSVARHDQLLA